MFIQLVVSIEYYIQPYHQVFVGPSQHLVHGQWNVIKTFTYNGMRIHLVITSEFIMVEDSLSGLLVC